jgi:hypothetical protein
MKIMQPEIDVTRAETPAPYYWQTAKQYAVDNPLDSRLVRLRPRNADYLIVPGNAG